DVLHMVVAAALELLEQEVADGGTVEDRAVERLVGELEDAPAVGAEPPPQRHAVRVLRRRGVEGSRRGRLPVHDDLLELLVVHPAASDVEGTECLLEVEATEDEPAL